jgi:DNA-binding XRE family transcriptional regulator
LPFCRSTVKSKRRDPRCPSVLNTLGDHLRKRFYDLDIQQKQAARLIAASEGSLIRWVKGCVAPTLPFWPRLIRFLGYDPRPASDGIGATLIRWRQGRGLNQKGLAKLLLVDPSTLARWERGERQPTGKFLDKVRTVLKT